MPNIKLILSEAAYTALHSQRVATESFQCISLRGFLNDDYLKQKQIIVEIEETLSLVEKGAKQQQKKDRGAWSPWEVGKLEELHALVVKRNYCCVILRRGRLFNNRCMESSSAVHSRSWLLLPVHSSIKALRFLIQVTIWPTPGKFLV